MARNCNIRCEVATTPEHIQHTVILKTICFVEEHGISPEFIFDRNDMQSTHFIWYDGDRPVGTLRIRWFADFAKFERTCFLPEYRHPSSIKNCVHMTFPHVARKGYRKILTQAEARLARLWALMFNGEILDAPAVKIEGHPDYLTIVGSIPESVNVEPITIKSDSALLLQIEGEWDKEIKP